MILTDISTVKIKEDDQWYDLGGKPILDKTLEWSKGLNKYLVGTETGLIILRSMMIVCSLAMDCLIISWYTYYALWGSSFRPVATSLLFNLTRLLLMAGFSI